MMTAESGVSIYEQGLRFAEGGKHSEALECITRHLRANPSDGQAHNDAGAILYCLGRTREAVSHLERARDIKGAHAEILWNLVEAYLAAGEPAKAAGLFADMHRAGLLNPEIFSRTADAFLQRGDKAGAIDMLLRSLELWPGQEVLEPMVTVVRSKRPRIGFFCGLADDTKFLTDIQQFTDARYPTTVFEGQSLEELGRTMQDSDICWFEWCTDMVVQASKLEKKSFNIVRLHRFEAYRPWPAQVNWENIDVLVLVGNRFVKEALLRQVPDIESRVRVVTIPNGVNLDRFEFRQRPRGKNIACIGYINLRKNPTLLLQCMQKLHYIDRDYKLFFAGNFQDPMLEQYIRHMVKAMELEDVVFFDGWQEDINAWLADKHFVISGSVGESQGMGVLEAMACGLKPVVHNFPGADEIFSPDFLFNIAEEFCRRILADDYEPARYRSFVEQRYPLGEQLDRINELFVGFERQIDSAGGPAESVPSVTDISSETVLQEDDFAAPAQAAGDAAVEDDFNLPVADFGQTGFEDFQSAGPSETAAADSNASQDAFDKQANESGDFEGFPGFDSLSGPVDLSFEPQDAQPAAEPAAATDANNKVLVEYNAVVGDILCMEPALRALKKQLGSGGEVVVRTNHPEIFKNHPVINSVEDSTSGEVSDDYSRRIELSWVATREVRDLHLVDRAARQMGVELEDRRPRLYLDDEDFASIEGFALPVEGPKVALGPGVRWPSRRWSAQKWRFLCRLMEARLGVKIIQLGANDGGFLGFGTDLVGKTDVRQAAAVISRCDVFVGLDNGLAHIAAAVDTPPVVLFGPVLPEKRMHGGAGRAVVSPGRCRGCFHSMDWQDDQPPRVCPKGDTECMELISVESVFAAVSDLLSGAGDAQNTVNG